MLQLYLVYSLGVAIASDDVIEARRPELLHKVALLQDVQTDGPKAKHLIHQQ